MLFAVHIDNGVLQPSWLLAGFAAASLLCWLGARRLREAEIPRIALLTAVFFVVTTIHIKVAAGSSVHLLGNSLVGIILGRRAALAITVGLLLQAMLLFHGGLQALGVNSCVISLPALGAWLAFQTLHRRRWITHPLGRTLLVFAAVLFGLLTLIYSSVLLATNVLASVEKLDATSANKWTLDPLVLMGTVVAAAVITWLERLMENAPEFPLGLLIGELTVLATIGLNFLVLAFGGESQSIAAPLINFVVNLPLALIEGVVLGVTLGFLMRVKPDMLLASRQTDPKKEDRQDRHV